MVKKPKKHVHRFDWLGETRCSTYEWCQACGAIRKTDLEGDEGTKIFTITGVK